MARMGDLVVKLDIEPTVKLCCMCTECIHNRHGTCNLKGLRLDGYGTCESMQLRKKAGGGGR